MNLDCVTAVPNSELEDGESNRICSIVGRLSLLGLTLLTAALWITYHLTDLHDDNVALSNPIVLLVEFAILSIVWLAWRPRSRGTLFLQFLSDLALITALIYQTGGTISPFLFLYLALIASASLMVDRIMALIFVALGVVAYTTLAVLLYHDLLRPASAAYANVTPANGIVLQVLGLSSAMILIAVAVNFLRRKMQSSQRAVESSTRRLATINARQRALIDSIPEGVLLLDAQGTIMSANPAAEKLLQCGDGGLHGQRFLAVFAKLVREECVVGLLERSQNEQVELTLKSKDGELKLVCSNRPVLDSEEAEGDTLFFLEDVTKLHTFKEQLDLQQRMAQLLSEKSCPTGQSQARLPEFVGESVVMQKVFDLIEKVAASEANVLISGESGTGKELVAKAIHLGSGQRLSKFVAINCGAVPESLIESQLFGHKKGSFTGADRDYLGLFQQADGGTLFLDEVAEIPLHLQAKLLRVIQERQVRPIGGSQDVSVKVRILSATNKNLRLEVDAGRFREDLYYRLNVIGINLPPLRERREDLPLLVNSILKRIVHGDASPVIPPAAMQYLLNYDYEGNVRELENILERAVVLGGAVILPEHLPERVLQYRPGQASLRQETRVIECQDLVLPTNLDEVLREIERRYLEEALAQANGVKKRAAGLLGINFRSLRYRLQKFDLGEN